MAKNFLSFASNYLQIWLALAKNSLIRNLEYRFNFLGRVFLDVIWVSTQILFFVSVFRFTPQLGGWSESEIWFFTGTLILLDGLFVLTLHDNLMRFSDLTLRGLFDFHLLRPTSALFLACFRYVNPNAVINFISAAVLLVYAASRPDLHLSLFDLFIWVLYSGLGFVLIAALAITICSFAFWATEGSYLMWLFFELYRLGFRPESFYGAWLRRLLLSVFPAAFFVSVPTQLALGKLGGFWYFWPWFVACVSMSLALFLWRRGIRRFEGALG